ncbi:MAG: hypothetical protein LBP67_04610 [Bacteroidales bacterium]|jgi:hypothetical protein|nr:hypothetical protein [Bacteroidales bacterium]
MNNLINNFTKVIIGIVCLLILISCAPKPQLAVIKAPVMEDVLISSDDLKAYLASHPKLSVVLRIPQNTENITSAQKENNTTFYNELEKALIMNGFDVKDRASVENILKNTTDIFDYEQIGKKLKVDLFIEITELSFYEPYYPSEYKIKSTGQKYTITNKILNTSYARLSYKIVIAETGSVGGMFTVYKQRCTEGCEFDVIYRDGMLPKYRLPEQRNNDMWYDKINWTFYNTYAEISAYFSNQLINTLRNK